MGKIILSMLLILSGEAALAACNEEALATCTAAEVKDLLQQYLVNYTPAKAKALKQELIARGAAAEAMDLLVHGQSTASAYWATEILEALRSPSTEALLKPYATDEPTLAAYNANMYFAETGNAFALENLNKNFAQYPVPAYSWGTAVFLFGKYKFKPASEHLVTAIMADNPNIADAAIASLVAIYNPPKKDIDGFGKYRDIQTYFEKLLAAKRSITTQ